MTTTDLTTLTAAALDEITDPLERAKAASTLERSAAALATAYARERRRAIKAAVEAGTSQTDVATALGITRGMVNKILARQEAEADEVQP